MKDINAFSLAGRKKRHSAMLKSRHTIHPLPVSVSSFGMLFPQPPLPTMQASVIVPAKDESAHIISTLEALRNQYNTDGQPLSHNVYEVLLLTNNCSDDTYRLAKEYQQQYPGFRLYIADIMLGKMDAHIGTVRRLLMDEAFRRHTQNGNDGLILSTDSDTEVDARWISGTIREMSLGYDAVGGRILARNAKVEGRHYYLLDTAYRCLAARAEAMINGEESCAKTSHFQCFGASLAVRCSAYQRAGRLPVIPFLEDEAFSRALYRVDARIKKSSAVKVYTSSRIQGKVRAGLSVHLAHLGSMQKNNITLYVESVATLLEKYRIKRQLRTAWQQRGARFLFSALLAQIELASGVPRFFLIKEMTRCAYFGECWEKVETAMYTGSWKQKQKPVDIVHAIRELRKYLKEENRLSA